MIYYLGKKYKWFRIWYHKRTQKWLWGVIGVIQTPECFSVYRATPQISGEVEYQKLLSNIFK